GRLEETVGGPELEVHLLVAVAGLARTADRGQAVQRSALRLRQVTRPIRAHRLRDGRAIVRPLDDVAPRRIREHRLLDAAPHDRDACPRDPLAGPRVADDPREAQESLASSIRLLRTGAARREEERQEDERRAASVTRTTVKVGEHLTGSGERRGTGAVRRETTGAEPL